MGIRHNEPVIGAHIELRPTRGGEQKPYIVGTRIGVDTIYVCHELQGMTPDAIVEAYPHLNLAQVHSALAYYYDHSDEVRDQLKRDREFADRLEAEQGTTRFTAVRDALLGNKDGGNGNPVSS